MEIRLIPFADAGGLGKNYKVWLPLRTGDSQNLLLEGTESRSRKGNLDGSINDENPDSCVVTFDGKPADEDWFAVTLDEPATIGRVVFVHGRTFPDGGWFDASAGKPRIQIQTSKGSAWETVGELKDYPATTAITSVTKSTGRLKGCESFSCQLSVPVKVFGVRVVGKPACGNKPKQAFSSCAELQAFAK